MVHRYTAILVTAVVIAAAVQGIKAARAGNGQLALWAAALAPCLVLVQIGLGVLTVITGIGLVEVTAHLAVGALLFADMFVLYLALGANAEGVGAMASPRSVPSVQPQIQGALP